MAGVPRCRELPALAGFWLTRGTLAYGRPRLCTPGELQAGFEWRGQVCGAHQRPIH